MPVFCFLLLIVFSGSSWADECEQLPKPSVTVRLIEESLTFNSQYSYKSLSNIGASLTRPGHQVLGLTRGNAVVRFSASTPIHFDRTGRWECASPQLVLSVGYSPLTVYVAKEFPEGSCAYKEIYEHELRHVKTYQNHLKAIEKALAETLNQRFATGGPWRGPAGQTAARIQREIDERWIPYVKREIGRVDAAQALIDTPEEYARVAESCGGEIKKGTRRAQ